MENILQTILNNIELVTAIVVAISGLVLLIVQKYKEIARALAEKELQTAANALIAKAETAPKLLYGELLQKPTIHAGAFIDSNDGKNSIVTQALIEQKPSLLKKLKLKDALSVANWVSNAYQIVKPAIKVLK